MLLEVVHEIGYMDWRTTLLLEKHGFSGVACIKVATS